MMQIRTRAYSRYSKEAAALLGKLIKLGRKERRLTAQDVADRAGITRNTLRKIENGDLKCEVGLVFEVATIVGVALFDAEKSTLTMHTRQVDDKLALLPKSTHKPQRGIEDDF